MNVGEALPPCSFLFRLERNVFLLKRVIKVMSISWQVLRLETNVFLLKQENEVMFSWHVFNLEKNCFG